MFRKFRFACLLAAVPFGPALAADLDPPIYADQAPEYTPVEVGSGWYLRGDVGYQFEGAYDDERSLDRDYRLGSVDLDQSEDYFTGSLGFGYHFTDYLRADVNGGYIPGNEADIGYDDGGNRAEGELSNDAWYGMANVYVDLGTIAGFTPYVGAGAGVLANKWEWKGDYDLDGDDPHRDGGSDRGTAFAYALNAGVAYRVADNFSVDLGYQYVASPDAEYVDVTDPESFESREGLDFHQVRLGLRYDLW